MNRDNLINFVRGVDTFDQDADNNTTESIHKLADIYHSELIVVAAPEAPNSNTGNSNHDKTDSYYRNQNNYNNFIIGSSDVLSASFEIDYELNNIFGNDKLNFTLSQPNRVEKGDMKFRLIGLSNKNGIIPYQDHTIRLRPNGRQKDIILSYYKNFKDDFKFGLKSIVTDDLGHIKDSNLRTNFLATFSLSF